MFLIFVQEVLTLPSLCQSHRVPGRPSFWVFLLCPSSSPFTQPPCRSCHRLLTGGRSTLWGAAIQWSPVGLRLLGQPPFIIWHCRRKHCIGFWPHPRYPGDWLWLRCPRVSWLLCRHPNRLPGVPHLPGGWEARLFPVPKRLVKQRGTVLFKEKNYETKRYLLSCKLKKERRMIKLHTT